MACPSRSLASRPLLSVSIRRSCPSGSPRDSRSRFGPDVRRDRLPSPRKKDRSTVPHSIVRYLFALVLTSAIVMMFVARVIFGIGVFVWLRFGEYDRVAFAIQEGAPFLILPVVLWVASFGLLRVRLWGWWQALVGSLGAIAHGICRYSLFVALVPGNASPVPWFPRILEDR